MVALLIVGLLLLVIPYRLARGFPMVSRMSIVLIVVVKSVIMILWHASLVRSTGLPIILDSSIDEKRYYDFGEAFLNYHLLDITESDIMRERGASSHLGYFIVNLVAFKACPDDPLLFLRLAKLLLFHIGLGMLATIWRLQSNSTRAMVGYFIVGVVFYDFFYYTFRDLKDDMILSLFMMILAVMDRSAVQARLGNAPSLSRTLLSWSFIGLLVYATSTLRFYLALAYVSAFAMHVITGRGLKITYRIMLAAAVAGAFVVLSGMRGYDLVQERGGGEAVVESAGNIYGLFKVFVTPLPWQHGIPALAVPHTFYLFMLAPTLWALLSRIHQNLDWKLYLVLLLALVLGGFMGDFEPRKRFILYPIFVGWILAAGRKQGTAATAPEEFDPDAYFAKQRNVYT